MEGVIRRAKSINPEIKIVPLVFASKIGSHHSTANVLHAGIAFLAAHYEIVAVDVNARLGRRFGPKVFDLPGAYGDTAHYQRPMLTTIVAEIISDGIAEYLLAGQTTLDIPYPIDVESYAGAQVIKAAQLKGAELGAFKNSPYDVITANVGPGAVDLTIEGARS